jgi:hypothetical protein
MFGKSSIYGRRQLNQRNISVGRPKVEVLLEGLGVDGRTILK